MESIKEVFSIFFFASIGICVSWVCQWAYHLLYLIGFHVFPTFLFVEFFTIFTVTMCVLLLKVCTELKILVTILVLLSSISLINSYLIAIQFKNKFYKSLVVHINSNK